MTLVFREGLMSVELPEGAVETWLDGPGTRLEVQLSGVSVMLRTNMFKPHTPEGFQKKYGGELLREEHDSEHSALAVRGASGGGRSAGELEVYGWAPGLMCIADDVPMNRLDEIFEVCASVRRVGGILNLGQAPKVHESTTLGMKSLSVETDQFNVQRVEERRLRCDNLLHTAVLYKREHLVEITERDGEYGKVKVWYEPVEDGEEATVLRGYAERDGQCCVFSTYDWVGPVPERDVAAVAGLCDKAAQPGWPLAFLPEPGASPG